ncbi:hypothetical protein A5654_21495 [Mycolicibacterium fortuitum]|nr:hypothetical protein A5654_21495 [Mycolicibacterium fortuitum]
MDRQKLADEWDDGISPAVAGLAGLAEPYGVALDYSAQSLRALEHVITTLFHQPEDLFTDDDRPVVPLISQLLTIHLATFCCNCYRGGRHELSAGEDCAP